MEFVKKYLSSGRFKQEEVGAVIKIAASQS